MNITNKYYSKLIKLSLRQNMREYRSEKPVFSQILHSETMIGPINPNPYIHWLSKKNTTRGIFRTQSDIRDKVFCKNTKQAFAVVL